MPYITINLTPKVHQITFEELFNGIDEDLFLPKKDTHDTYTRFVNILPAKLHASFNVSAGINLLKRFNQKYDALISEQDKSLFYSTFMLEKKGKGMSDVFKSVLKTRKNKEQATYYKTLYGDIARLLQPVISNHPCSEHGKMESSATAKCEELLRSLGFDCSAEQIKEFIKEAYRRIDAPNDELKSALSDFKHLLESVFYANYHTSAFAYIHGRCTVDCVKRHQSNNSRWFLKLDFSKFFPSTTQRFMTNMLLQTFPICCLQSTESGTFELEKALGLCFLNGGLPQGTPTSPTLTNMMMIPIDHAITKYCREHSPHLCYTRYADDMLISSEFKFDWESVQQAVVDTLAKFEAPFALNTEKTRFGSSAGRNWNLGVMLNKDNQITIGYEKKKVFKAMLNSFALDYQNGHPWDIDEIQHMLGLYSYYRMVEPGIDSVVERYSQKFNKDIIATARALLST